MTKRKIKVETTPSIGEGQPVSEPTLEEKPETPVSEPATPEAAPAPTEQETAEVEPDWKAEALRLQADMQNFRRRQEQRAEFLIQEERQRLLRKFLEVADNLEKALKLLKPDDPVQQGVKTTYDALMNLLRVEGVTPIAAKGQAFDPALHEAITMLPAPEGQEVELLVLDEIQRGYRLHEQVLRPSRVVVSQKA